jgi:hypothetical protein
MDKIKEKLHIGSSKKTTTDNDATTFGSSSTSGHGVGTIEGTLDV